MNSGLRHDLIRMSTLVGLTVLCLLRPVLAQEPLDRLVDLGVEPTHAGQLLRRWAQTQQTTPVDELVDVLAAAIAAQAPPDLVADKAAEGLAKGVPVRRLLPALRVWGGQIAQAAQLARQISSELDAGGIASRDLVLRVHLLQRLRQDDSWLHRLHAEAVATEATVADLLAIGESVGQLANQGLSAARADELGRSWLGSGVDATAAPSLLRAIEAAHDAMPLASAADHVTQRTLEGWSADDVLNEVTQALADQQLDAGRNRMPAARGMGGMADPMTPEPGDDASREVDDAGRLYDENGRLIGEQDDPAGVEEDVEGREDEGGGEGRDRGSQEIDNEQETDENGRG